LRGQANPGILGKRPDDQSGSELGRDWSEGAKQAAEEGDGEGRRTMRKLRVKKYNSDIFSTD